MWKNDFGAGLYDEDIANGITTIDDKINQHCPHFKRMHALFGEHANINPPMIGSFGCGDDKITHPPPDDDVDADAAPRTPTEKLGLSIIIIGSFS